MAGFRRLFNSLDTRDGSSFRAFDTLNSVDGHVPGRVLSRNLANGSFGFLWILGFLVVLLMQNSGISLALWDMVWTHRISVPQFFLFLDDSRRLEQEIGSGNQLRRGHHIPNGKWQQIPRTPDFVTLMKDVNYSNVFFYLLL
ncbi:uncharacterized protein OCT59_001632 [Rhizophagus irregularis]|uniref:uncharacterized protein n=1 Tax=Rhizophagus irregularis TaxID=588596 RepID=UPI0033196963|nr:hypothetical protein OCT59_001632 [Rhizophagus irregularis]